MKTRPSVTPSVIGLRSCTIRTSLPCHRERPLRAAAFAASCSRRHIDAQKLLLPANNTTSWTASLARHSSTSAAPSSRSQHGRRMEPTPPSRTTDKNMQTKPISPSGTTRNNVAPIAKTASPGSNLITKAKDNLNPPSFTYAPDLSVPSRQPDQSFFKYIWRAGRAYLSFYKAGVSNVRQTSKLARSLREKSSETTAVDRSKALTRAEWQIIKRSKKDMLRLPAFGLIFLIFGEWTPLLVMYITPVIPEACRIPSQVKRQLSKIENRRQDRLRRAALESVRLMASDRPTVGSAKAYSNTPQAQVVPDAQAIQNMDPLKLTRYELVLTSARFDCHPRFFDLLQLTPPKFWLQRGVRKQFEYLRQDDALIERDGGFHALERREAERACIERGIDVLNKREDEMKKALATWFKERKA